MTSSTMAGNAQLDASHSPAQLRVTGDWTLAHYADLKQLSEKLHGQYDDDTHIDLNGLGALDTAGASLLVELLGSERLGRSAEHPDCTLSTADRALLQTVYRSLTDFCVPVKEPEISVGIQLLTRIGRAVDAVWQDTLAIARLRRPDPGNHRPWTVSPQTLAHHADGGAHRTDRPRRRAHRCPADFFGGRRSGVSRRNACWRVSARVFSPWTSLGFPSCANSVCC